MGVKEWNNEATKPTLHKVVVLMCMFARRTLLVQEPNFSRLTGTISFAVIVIAFGLAFSASVRTFALSFPRAVKSALEFTLRFTHTYHIYYRLKRLVHQRNFELRT